MFNPDSFNGTFVFNRCIHCKQEWECYRTEINYECDECVNRLYPQQDGEDHRDGDDK